MHAVIGLAGFPHRGFIFPQATLILLSWGQVAWAMDSTGLKQQQGLEIEPGTTKKDHPVRSGVEPWTYKTLCAQGTQKIYRSHMKNTQISHKNIADSTQKL